MSGPAPMRGLANARGWLGRPLTASVLAVLLLPVSTLAHAQVVALDPVAGARLPVTPSAVSVTFNEAVTLAPGGLRVVRPDGSLADIDEDALSGTTVRQDIEPLADGWYVMAWSLISEDGHVIHGSATFAVGDADDASRPTAPTLASPLQTALWLTRGLADLMLLVAAGAGVAWTVLLARTGRVHRLWLAGLSLGVLGLAAWLAVELADAGTSWMTTGYAQSGFGRLALLAAALALLLLRPSRPRAAAVLTCLSVLTLAFGGHATDSPVTSITLAVHLLAAIAWLGAAPAVALVLWDRRVPDEQALTTVRGFSRLATVTLLVVFAGGAASALLLTNGLEGGLTIYVWIVLAKVVVVGLAAIMGALGRRGLHTGDRRHYRRLFLLDACLLMVVALLSSALTLVGPHQGHAGHGGHEVTSPRCSMTVGEGSDVFGAAFVATPGRPGTNELLVSGVPATAQDASAQLLHPYAGGASIDVPLEATDRGWSGAAPLPFTGAWTVTLLVRVDAFTQARGSCQFSVAP